MAKNTDPVFPRALDFKPRLRGLKSGRTTFTRIMRAYAAGLIDHESMRVWCYTFATWLNIVKTESEQLILDKLETIEKRLTEIEGGRLEHSKKRITAFK